jgi:hypothetical protein
LATASLARWSTFSLTITNWLEMDIERVFSVIDVAVSSLPRGSQEHKAFCMARACLLDWITLEMKARCMGQHCGHLRRLFRDLGPQDTVISFNWDTLADATLDLLDTVQYRNYTRMMSDPRIRPDSGLFIKLHGSVNWWTCPNTLCRNHRSIVLQHDPGEPPGRRTSRPLWDESEGKCSLCGKRLEPALVPPTSRKLLDRGSQFHRFWMHARKRVLDADRLVVIGYSLPITDVHAEWLLREATLYSRPPHEVILVDPETIDENSDLLRRYRSVFGSGAIRRTYRDLVAYIADTTGEAPGSWLSSDQAGQAE